MPNGAVGFLDEKKIPPIRPPCRPITASIQTGLPSYHT
jgi:hypothetical protein